MSTSKTATETSVGVKLESTEGVQQPDLKLALATAHKDYTLNNLESKRLFETSLLFPATIRGPSSTPIPSLWHSVEAMVIHYPLSMEVRIYTFLNEYSAGIYSKDDRGANTSCSGQSYCLITRETMSQVQFHIKEATADSPFI
jgi:hypothetical protein